MIRYFFPMDIFLCKKINLSCDLGRSFVQASKQELQELMSCNVTSVFNSGVTFLKAGDNLNLFLGRGWLQNPFVC